MVRKRSHSLIEEVKRERESLIQTPLKKSALYGNVCNYFRYFVIYARMHILFN